MPSTLHGLTSAAGSRRLRSSMRLQWITCDADVAPTAVVTRSNREACASSPIGNSARARREVGAFRSGVGRRGVQAMLDPLRGQLFLHGVLRQARIEPGKIDAVERLILIEAGKNVAELAGRGIVLRLQALRA